MKIIVNFEFLNLMKQKQISSYLPTSKIDSTRLCQKTKMPPKSQNTPPLTSIISKPI